MGSTLSGMSVSIDVQLSISTILDLRDSLSSLYRADMLEGVIDRDMLGRTGNVGLGAPINEGGGRMDGGWVDDVECLNAGDCWFGGRV